VTQVVALERFRTDLLSVSDRLEALCRKLADAGYSLSPVRVLEVLICTEVEPGSYYRSTAPGPQAPTHSKDVPDVQ
jgi:hypothetical protein